jgi:hypothetical protein
VSQAAEYRKNGLGLAGLAQVGDASYTFGLFAAAEIVKADRGTRGSPRGDSVMNPLMRLRSVWKGAGIDAFYRTRVG